MIKIVCVGKVKEKAMSVLIEDYLKRIAHFHKIELVQLKEANSSFEQSKIIDTESNDILNAISPNDFVVLMDIGGTMMSSIDFSKRLEKWLESGLSCVFVIGGSDGVSEKVRTRANFRFSMSHQTFPHLLFRLMLLEQIYRCFKIQNNQVYHK